MTRSRILLVLPLAAAALAGVALLAPLARVNRLRLPVQEHLERVLDRRVEIAGPVRVQILPSPRLSVEQVIIHEDPSIGLEPVAYVSAAELRLRLVSLLRGQLGFATLRLVKPSVNLTKTADGRWNYPPILRRAFAGVPARGARVPRIEVRSGRLNFKFGDTKSVFYFAQADVDITPSFGREQALQVRFAGSPARTDRAAQGFGKFSGNGQFVFVEEGEDRVRFVVRLERSAIAEIVTLLRGRGGGLRGFVASRAELEGPISGIGLTGRLHLAGLGGSFLLPERQGDWALDYQGRLDLPAQDLILEAIPAGEGGVPVAARIRVQDYLTRPNWAVLATLDRFPLETLMALARELEMGLPDNAEVRGLVSGAAGWSRAAPLQGLFALQEAGVRTRHGNIGLTDAAFAVDGDQVRFQAPRLTFGDRGQASVTGVLRPGERAVEATVQARDLPIEEAIGVWQDLSDEPPPLALAIWNRGRWGGELRYRRTGDEAGAWSGTVNVLDGEARIPGLAEPVRARMAKGTQRGARLEFPVILGSAGGIPFSAEYERDPTAQRPHRLRLSAPELDIARLQALLEPTMRRQGRGFIARTLGLEGGEAPHWLPGRRAEVEIAAAKVRAGPLGLQRLRGRLYWDDRHAELSGLDARSGETRVTGSASVDIGGQAARYLLRLKLSDYPWQGGRLNAEGRLRTSGYGAQMLARARAEGEFTARGLHTRDGVALALVSGCYEFGMVNGLPRLVFSALRLKTGEVTYHGWGEAAGTGNLELELFTGERNYGATGELAPLRIQIEPDAAAAGAAQTGGLLK